jgi:hypothetical protein
MGSSLSVFYTSIWFHFEWWWVGKKTRGIFGGQLSNIFWNILYCVGVQDNIMDQSELLKTCIQLSVG